MLQACQAGSTLHFQDGPLCSVHTVWHMQMTLPTTQVLLQQLDLTRCQLQQLQLPGAENSANMGHVHDLNPFC